MRTIRGRVSGGRMTGVIATAITGMVGAGLVMAPSSAAAAAPLNGVPGAQPSPVEVAAPLLTPESGSHLEGTVGVAAVPVTADDSVVSLAVDGEEIDASPTVGFSTLSFDVGSNSIEARYGNYIIVNGDYRIDLADAVSERVELEVPNEHLVQGENSIEFVTGIYGTSCGDNHDDFVVSNVGLELLGEVADGEENEYSFDFGDGNCGSSPAKLLDAELTFFVLGDPQRTTGLSTELDTSVFVNGAHVITATTAAGGTVTNEVSVNNAPVGAPALTPVDGTIATGLQQIFATQPAGSAAGVAELLLDGDTLASQSVLGSGDAVLSFTVASNSIEARYHSYIVVNGMVLDIGGDYQSERVNVVFPNEWLNPGANDVQLVTGTFATSCGANRDDYTISSVALATAAGSATGVGLSGTYKMGDGSCGSNTVLLRDATFTFDIDAPARGLRADLDTTTVADGEHIIAAAATTGEVATRTVAFDNTGPAVTSTIPAAGATMTKSVALDVQLHDASGILDGPNVTLDGEPVVLADPIGPGLSAGAHTLVVTATDGLGNESTHEIAFTSAGIPDVPAELAPASGTADVTGPATLSATVGEPDGGDVTATFSQADILTPNQVWQGTSTGIPTTLQVAGERKVNDAGALEPGDGETLDSDAGRDVVFQRFDVMVKGHVQDPVIRWTGIVDPDRLATLRAWNLQRRSWDALFASRGAADGDTVLTATVDDRYIDGQQIHIMVTGEDPFADDLEGGDPDAFTDADAVDFSIVHFTDTQYLSEGAVEQETAEERAVWESAYAGIVDWIADNADERDIAYVAHTGDLIENNIRAPQTDEMVQEIIGEWEVSSRQHDVLDAAGIPSGVVAGNHDNQSGTETGPDAIFNDYFGPENSESAAASWTQAQYGGPWREGDNQNHYDLFSAGGLDFVVVGLSYGVAREEAEWANSVFEQYSDRNGILLTHDYLAPSTNADGRDAALAPEGSMLYNTVVAENPNVFLILAGHRHGVGTNVKPKVGEIDHGVVELLADYQFYTVSADRLGLTEVGGYLPDDQLRFGASFFRLLSFDVDRSLMYVDTYSPLLDEFGATEYDDEHRFDGTEDEMVLPVDLTSRVTTLRTDSVVVFSPAEVIGEATVASGEIATVEWTRLKSDTAYAWIVTATTAGGGTSVSEPSVFVTTDAAGRPGTWNENSPWFPFLGDATP